MSGNYKIALTTILVFIVFCSISHAEEQSLDEISRKLENPLKSLWSLTFQENFSILKGDLIDTEYSNNFFSQPYLPIPIGSDFMFVARPVFQLVTNAILNPDSNNEIRNIDPPPYNRV
jgi:hypothetical protein